MSTELDLLAGKATSLVQEVRQNLDDLMAGCRSLQHPTPSGIKENTVTRTLQSSKHLPQSAVVRVSKADVDQLATETMMLKEFLPKLLTPDVLGSFSTLTQREQEVWALRKERETIEKELEHLRRRNESLKAEFEQEKQEKFSAKCEVNDLQQQLSQQADYCTSMGAACCTLLWRVSRQEESIHSILSGSKVKDLLQLGASTLQSYLDTYTNETLPNDTSLESQFVLALCGTITNVAASAYGRNFLSTNEEGQALIDVLCTALAEAPTGAECSKLKRLLLVTLYNISINQSGLHYLTSKPDLMRTLVWRLRDESDSANLLHIMRLLQSLILEPDNAGTVAQALEAVPLSLLQHLTNLPHQEVREMALELISDIQSLKMPH
ncbi:Heat shock factor 2-binding protein [Geodia barretti]|uniref:Heat shock factor 2-binding protein n=1 Tax=Geodia barretti TaxID=519541 RepID=A0AA35XLW1_GEOBA|nr:Heat shock factor 2-binding protein [Geodia barretti]